MSVTTQDDEEWAPRVVLFSREMWPSTRQPWALSVCWEWMTESLLVTQSCLFSSVLSDLATLTCRLDGFVFFFHRSVSQRWGSLTETFILIHAFYVIRMFWLSSAFSHPEDGEWFLKQIWFSHPIGKLKMKFLWGRSCAFISIYLNCRRMVVVLFILFIRITDARGVW